MQMKCLSQEQAKTLLDKQREFHLQYPKTTYEFRIAQLKKLKAQVEKYTDELNTALKLDLNKPETEVLLGELVIFNDEMNNALKSLKSWMKPKKVSSTFPSCFPGRSIIVKEPYGVVLIISPWNYPFLLTMAPLVGAIAAGNSVIIKPSELTPHTSNLMAKMIKEIFTEDYIAVVEGGAESVQNLLTEKFDYIFFTGGASIAKHVMKAASEHLTPVTLELGGKSPCIIDKTANLKFAARRIMWSKFMNAGQTCIAPDYLFVQQSIKEEFISHCLFYLKSFYGENTRETFPRIINEKHFDRLMNLTKAGKMLTEFVHDKTALYISPTLIDGIQFNDAIMQEEIFGPLLPIHTYQSLGEVIQYIQTQPKSLALYLFTQNKDNEQRILNEVSFGGGCINDCIMQMANSNLPFGGVGASGMGAYHSEYTFNTFSHHKSIFKRYFSFDVNLQYPPYTQKKLSWIKKLLTWS